MTNTTQLKRRSQHRGKAHKTKSKTAQFLIRIGIVLLVCLFVLSIIGFLKKGNIKKVNEHPKSFPVSVQN